MSSISFERLTASSRDVTTDHAWKLPPAEQLNAARRVPIIALPLVDSGFEGRGLLCAGDVVTGSQPRGMTVIVAPGDVAKTPDGRSDVRLAWRVAVFPTKSIDPSQTAPDLLVDRSLAWVVRLLRDMDDLLELRGQCAVGVPEVDDELQRSLECVARATRDVVRQELARLRPHLDREPHPAVAREARANLREHVIEAAGVFGQPWVEKTLGQWGHLVANVDPVSAAYLEVGHSAMDEFLGRRAVGSA